MRRGGDQGDSRLDEGGYRGLDEASAYYASIFVRVRGERDGKTILDVRGAHFAAVGREGFTRNWFLARRRPEPGTASSPDPKSSHAILSLS